MRALDLFAGPGGWDIGAAALGLRPLGLEYDDAACATRFSAGLDTIQIDVSLAEPDFRPCDLLIASPPCPTFSTAGDQQGALLTDLLVACARDLMEGEDSRDVARLGAFRLLLPTAKTAERATRDANMSLLVVEPLRYALALQPRYIALEQVPPVLPLWRFFASLLEQQGYATWAGILNSADFGVPQTRRRAFLIANLDGPARPPEPTHCRGGALTLERELLPWVSMAEALGWRGIVTTRGDRDEATGGNEFSADDPSWAVTGRARSWTARADLPSSTIVGTRRSKDGMLSGRALAPGQGVNIGGKNWKQRSGQSVNGEGRAERDGCEPSVTIHGRADLIAWVDENEQMPLLHTNRGQDENGDRQTRDGGSPAPTVSGKSGGQWVFERPATSVCGDPRLSPPGFRGTPADYEPDGTFIGKRSMDGAVRITLQEAAILQGFPADYPWQGTRTKQFEQVGNAVPPPLARAVLEALLA